MQRILQKCCRQRPFNTRGYVSSEYVTQAFYQRQRQDDAFNVFYDSVMKGAEELEIGEPVLPRYRKAPWRYDDGVGCVTDFQVL